MRRGQILKILLNPYSFTFPGSAPNPIRVGVSQGFIIFPLLFHHDVNNFVKELSDALGQVHVYSYADGRAVLCLRSADIRKSLAVIENWAIENSAWINKKKVWNFKDSKKAIEDWKETNRRCPLCSGLLVLGLPLNESFSVKHFVTGIKQRSKKFYSRLKFYSARYFDADVKLNIWQSYLRCYFDYYAPCDDTLLCSEEICQHIH